MEESVGRGSKGGSGFGNCGGKTPPPPGVSWNIFIPQGLGVVMVDRFDFIGFREIAPENPRDWLERPTLPPGVFGKERAALAKQKG